MQNQSTPPPPIDDEDEATLNNSLISTFCEITSASPSEALFYLESHNFNLDSAVSTFLETANPTTTAAAADSTVGNQNNPQSLSPTQSESYSPSQSQSPLSTPSRSRSPSPPPPRRSQYNLRSSSSSKPSTGAARGSARRGPSGVRTLADLNRQPSGDGADSDSDEPQEYYTGGEKSSGKFEEFYSRGSSLEK